jgi:cell wall-associated NlpC family hydrolase
MATTGCGSRASGPRPVDAAHPEEGGPRAGSGESIAAAAEARLGAPYVYGGNGGSGFDCSGLVCKVYGEHGIRLPRTVADQVRAGTRVDRLVPGDLVFFRLSGSTASHVGIYVGEGRFVHASTGRRRVVVDSLADDQYFRDRYVGARRIVPLSD